MVDHVDHIRHASALGRDYSRTFRTGAWRQQQRLALDVELEQHHVAVGDDVFLAFHAVEALFTGGSH
jgi:hypothetical protein